jgi:hypothetical protein
MLGEHARRYQRSALDEMPFTLPNSPLLESTELSRTRRGTTDAALSPEYVLPDYSLSLKLAQRSRDDMTGLMAGIGGQLLLSATEVAGFEPFCVGAIFLLSPGADRCDPRHHADQIPTAAPVSVSEKCAPSHPSD